VPKRVPQHSVCAYWGWRGRITSPVRFPRNTNQLPRRDRGEPADPTWKSCLGRVICVVTSFRLLLNPHPARTASTLIYRSKKRVAAHCRRRSPKPPKKPVSRVARHTRAAVLLAASPRHFDGPQQPSPPAPFRVPPSRAPNLLVYAFQSQLLPLVPRLPARYLPCLPDPRAGLQKPT